MKEKLLVFGLIFGLIFVLVLGTIGCGKTVVQEPVLTEQELVEPRAPTSTPITTIEAIPTFVSEKDLFVAEETEERLIEVEKSACDTVKAFYFTLNEKKYSEAQQYFLSDFFTLFQNPIFDRAGGIEKVFDIIKESITGF